MENYVFISFSSKNQDVADRLVDYLEQTEKIKCWICTRDIPAGTPYPRAIGYAIADCSCALLILSQHAQRSEHVENELELLVYQRKPVIVCRVDDSPLQGTFSYYLHKQQAFTLDSLSDDKLSLVAIALNKYLATSNSPYGSQRVAVSDADSSSSSVTHEHTFSDSWTWDSASHWHASTCGHDVVSDKAPHDFGSGKVCKVCGYTDESVLEYTIDSDKRGYIVSCSDKSVTKVTIPSFHDGLPVTGIGKYAFYQCSRLGEITIPVSVTSIDDGAFYKCANLRTVTFEDNSQLQSIGKCAFYQCSNLMKITIPSTVTSIGDSAFSNCSNLQTVIFKGDSHLQSIGTCAFFECSNLGRITIPRTVTGIDSSVFYSCSKLFAKDWTYDSTSHWHASTCDYIVKDKASHSFEGNVCKVCGYDRTLTYILNLDNKSYSVSCSDKSVTKVVIPSFHDGLPVTRISAWAFRDCGNLTEVTIPNGITYIGDQAFFGCRSLRKITLQTTVTSICSGAFSECTSLTEVAILGGVSRIGSDAFSGCGRLQRVQFGGDAELTCIESRAFHGCSSLREITIPSSVTTISEQVFYDCSQLQTVKFEGNSHLQEIYEEAFCNCSNLTEIILPSTVTRICDWAFGGCSKLTRVFFRDPRGWSYCDYSDSCVAISGFENAQTAARYLTDTYCAHDLFKRK